MNPTATSVEIRPFTGADYDEVTRLHNVNHPDFALDVDEFRFRDESLPEHCRWARWVAECDGEVVGFAHYQQNPGTYHPRKFSLSFAVDPRWYRRGVGTRLYDLVLRALRPFDPLSVDAWSREDMPCRVGFLERRGFVRDMLMWTSVLDLTTFDARRFDHLVPAAEAQGIQLRSLAELGVSDAGVQRKLYQLWLEVRQDVPLPPGDQRTEVSFERWWEQHDRPELLPAGYFVALDGDHYVATSQLWSSPEADTLRTGLTGVRRAYRRRGIAFALKARALAWAKELGYRRVLTENESNNRGMLAINEQLGFVKNPVWIHYLKTFAS